ncbi:hypothetical protein ABIB44_000773 [Hymenobacter sp. UYCo722]
MEDDVEIIGGGRGIESRGIPPGGPAWEPPEQRQRSGVGE